MPASSDGNGDSPRQGGLVSSRSRSLRQGAPNVAWPGPDKGMLAGVSKKSGRTDIGCKGKQEETDINKHF